MLGEWRDGLAGWTDLPADVGDFWLTVLERGLASGVEELANASQDEYNQLPEGFNGTFVYWELNENREESEWTL